MRRNKEEDKKKEEKKEENHEKEYEEEKNKGDEDDCTVDISHSNVCVHFAYQYILIYVYVLSVRQTFSTFAKQKGSPSTFQQITNDASKPLTSISLDKFCIKCKNWNNMGSLPHFT